MRFSTPGSGASSVARSGNIARWLGALFLAMMLAACGGGGDNNNSSSNSGGSSGGNAGGSAGGSSGSSTANAQPSAVNNTNAVPINVNSGAAGFVNIPNVSVKVCAPGSTTICQTIDNIQLDTASFGLRILSSSASAVLGNLPTARASNGGQLAECAGFADGYTWGTVRTADVSMGTETASGVPVQIIGDLNASAAPTGLNGCPSGNDENNISEIGANGILGVGPATYDCGTSCVSSAQNAMYFSCTNGANCTGVAVPLTQQVTNPVTKFPADNNGVIVQLPPISDTGAASASGTLIFGIGTQSNNTVTGVTKFGTDGFGDLSGVYKGTTYQTFFDTGSNGNFFQDTFTLCSSTSSFYCPSSEQSLSTVITGTGTNANSVTVPFSLVSARTLTSGGGNYAFNSLGGQLGMSGFFDFGLPFFFGRHVYVGYDLPGSSPYVAF